MNTEFASAILTVNRVKKREMLLVVINKDRKYISDRMSSQIVAYIISKEKKKPVYFADEQVDTMKDFSMSRKKLSKSRHSSTAAKELSEIWGLSISQAALILKTTTKNLTIYAIIPLARR